MGTRNPFRWQNIDPAYAGVYDEFRGGFSSAAIHHLLERSGVKPGEGRILDLACGTGAVTHRLRGAADEVIGVDAAWPMLTQARRRFPNLPFTRADGHQLPFATGQFDLITIGQAIHWFELPRLFAEIRRILRPGGWLAVLSRYPSPQSRLHALVEKIRYPYTPEGKQGVPAWTSSAAPSNLLGLESAGFTEYDRHVFAWEVEYTLEGYTEGVIERALRRSYLDAEQRRRLETELRSALRAEAHDGLLVEPMLDYVFMARRPPESIAG